MFCSVFTRGTTIPQKRQNDTKHVNYVLNLLLSPEILHGQKVIRQDENKSRWLFYYQYYFTEGLINVILHFQTIADADSFTASNDVYTNATHLDTTNRIFM